jgi:hypothetical protein
MTLPSIESGQRRMQSTTRTASNLLSDLRPIQSNKSSVKRVSELSELVNKWAPDLSSRVS